MSKNLLVPLAVSLLFLSGAHSQESSTVYAQQNAPGRVCADVPGQTSGTRRFLRAGETIKISLRGDVDGGDGADGVRDVEGVAGGASAHVADCEPVALDLYWSNGRNNGSNFYLTFLDNTNKPIYTKSFSGFLNGNLQFDLSSSDFQRVYSSSMTVISVPAAVTIQAVSPFAAPVGLSYAVTRVARAPKAREKGEEEQETGAGGSGRKREENTGDVNTSQGNEVVSIRKVVRLIGASKLPLVQIELKTAHPFPIAESPLQLKIGKRVFVDELSGDYTGRKLTLSLTPDMFAELQDGDEIVATFAKHDGKESAEQSVWYFGKLDKKQ